MHGTGLFVSAYVIIGEGCPVAISVQNPDQAEIVCGWAPNRSFDFVVHRDALRALVELGAEALDRMDAESDELTANTAAC